MSGQFLRRQRLPPLRLELGVDEGQDDPDRNAPEHVPGGGLDRRALRPQADERRGHRQRELDHEPDGGGGRAAAVGKLVRCHAHWTWEHHGVTGRFSGDIALPYTPFQVYLAGSPPSRYAY